LIRRTPCHTVFAAGIEYWAKFDQFPGAIFSGHFSNFKRLHLLDDLGSSRAAISDMRRS
jgi:hypothetical protein